MSLVTRTPGAGADTQPAKRSAAPKAAEMCEAADQPVPGTCGKLPEDRRRRKMEGSAAFSNVVVSGSMDRPARILDAHLESKHTPVVDRQPRQMTSGASSRLLVLQRTGSPACSRGSPRTRERAQAAGGASLARTPLAWDCNLKDRRGIYTHSAKPKPLDDSSYTKQTHTTHSKMRHKPL